MMYTMLETSAGQVSIGLGVNHTAEGWVVRNEQGQYLFSSDRGREHHWRNSPSIIWEAVSWSSIFGKKEYLEVKRLAKICSSERSAKRYAAKYGGRAVKATAQELIEATLKMLQEKELAKAVAH